MPSRAGSLNKNKEFLNNRLKAMYGEDFDPIIRASEQAILLHAEAMDTDENKVQALKASVDAWLKIGEYVHPKLKSIEHDIGDNLKGDLNDLLDDIESKA